MQQRISKKAAGEALPPSKPLTGPAPPRRSVCAPGAIALPLYRRPPATRRVTMSLRPWLDSLKSVCQRRQAPQARAPRPRRPKLSLEPLEDRSLPSANVVTEWNQVLLDTFKADRVGAVFFGREAA